MMKRSNMKIRVFWSVIALTVTIGLCFQNCSNAVLEKVEMAETVFWTPSLELKSDICSKAKMVAGETSKFVFVIDLSASNFGDWKQELKGNQWLLYWDPSKATDQDGARFEAVKYFLQNCGSQLGAQFAVVGFSGSAGVLKNNALTCDNVQFGTPSEATASLDALKARQVEDEKWYKRWIYPSYMTENPPDSLIYTVTSYTSASKCVEKLVVNDLSSSGGGLADRYHIFFISDGVPRDKNGTGCEAAASTPEGKASCYLESNLSSITMSRTAAISKGKDLRIQGIYYGTAGGATLPAVLDAMSKEGGTAGAVKLEGFAQNQTALCDMVVTQNAIDYRPDLYTVINMTVKRKNGALVADSDMDGISDGDEIAMGYDPQNPRSSGVSGVLDGICERLGGISICQAKRDAITCNPNQFDALGMTDCDIKILKLDQITGVLDPGVDSDRDGMPDYVEIVKGTDPGKQDMTSDPDHDSVITRDEILRGSEPFLPDGGLNEALINSTRMEFLPHSPAPECTQGDWQLSVNRMQVTRTMSVTGFPSSLSMLNHGRNDQVLLFIYRLTPANSSNPTIEYYAKYVLVSARGKVGAEQLEATPSHVIPSDYIFIGKANP